MPFLKEDELDTFVQYRLLEEDNSVTTKVLTPVWRLLAHIVPPDIAPNALSLSGLVCLLQACYVNYYYVDSHPQQCAAVSAVLIFLFWTLDALDSVHARNIGGPTSLTVFFDSMCSSVGTVFLTLVVCRSMSVAGHLSLWYAVQASQLVLLNKHLSGVVRHVVRYAVFNGPGELLSTIVGILLLRAMFDLDVIFSFIQSTAIRLATTMELSHQERALAPQNAEQVLRGVYIALLLITVLRVALLPAKHNHTRLRLLLCLTYRAVPLGLMSIFGSDITLIQVICDGLFMSVVTSDVLLSRMSSRQVHGWVVMMGMASLVSTFISLICFAFYVVKTLHEIASYSQESLLSANINVYCDGVYDLCHLGHMRAYRNALAHGTRLFVGVCSDEDVMVYKRAPIMSMEERIAIVSSCKFVSKVIPRAPCTKGALTEEFMRKHNIHIVCAGKEYDREDDEWYRVPRELGRLRYLPRTTGVSTSTLIKRIQERYEQEGQDAPKDANTYTASSNDSGKTEGS